MQIVRIFRDGVGLLFRFDLQPMLDAPKETISALEQSSFAVRKKLEVREDGQDFPGARFLEERVPRPVQKLQGLHDKFDLANAARAQLYVPFDILVLTISRSDPPLDRTDFFQDIAGGTLRKDEWLVLPEKLVRPVRGSPRCRALL